MDTITEKNQAIANFMAGKEVETNHNKYHENWNELMPVVEKIKSLNEFQLKHMSQWISFEHRLKESMWIGIEPLYNQVVQFIQWYNKNKST